MKKKFITNLALLLFLNLLIKPFWIFGIDRSVQNMIGAGEYGIYLALFNFSFILNILLDLGITNFNNRNIAQHPERLSLHFSNIVILRFVLALVYAVVCILVGIISGYDKRQLLIIVFLIINQFLLSFILYLRSNLSGLHLFRLDSFVSVADRLLLIIICSVLLWGNVLSKPITVELFVYAQTATYFVVAIGVFFIVFSKVKVFKLKFDFRFFVSVLKESYPFALLALLMAFYNRIDTVMLERMLPDGAVQAGIYAHSFRFLEAMTIFPYLFASLLLPIFSRMIAKAEPVNQMVRLSSVLLLVPVLAFVIPAYFFRFPVIDWLYVEHIQQSSEIFGILILGLIPYSISYIFGTLVTANGNLRQLNIMAASGMVLNIGLNAILIPRYQAMGAAVASLITQCYTALVQVLIAKQKFVFAMDWKTLAHLTIFFVLIGTFSVFIKTLNYDWRLLFIGCVAFAGLLAIASKLINVKDLLKILKSEN